MSCYLDYLVGAACKPDVAILINVGGVSGKVDLLSRKTSPVIGGVAVHFTPEGGRQAGEGTLDNQNALFFRTTQFTFRGHNGHIYTRQGYGGGAGLSRQQ